LHAPPTRAFSQRPGQGLCWSSFLPCLFVEDNTTLPGPFFPPAVTLFHNWFDPPAPKTRCSFSLLFPPYFFSKNSSFPGFRVKWRAGLSSPRRSCLFFLFSVTFPLGVFALLFAHRHPSFPRSERDPLNVFIGRHGGRLIIPFFPSLTCPRPLPFA